MKRYTEAFVCARPTRSGTNRCSRRLRKVGKGEDTRYSRELMDQIADRARRKMGSGEPIDPDFVG